MDLVYPARETWDSMFQQGVQLIERFVQDGRVEVSHPTQQQIQFSRTLSSGNNNFVAFIDAIGELDGVPSVLEWKTASARYPDEPAGIAGLDPQLICYSWMTGIDAVAQVVFVRKRTVKCSTCARPSLTSSGESLRPWSKTRFAVLSRGCSCRIAAFVFPRIRAPPVRLLGSALNSATWSMPR